jgi:hypothetical protein
MKIIIHRAKYKIAQYMLCIGWVFSGILSFGQSKDIPDGTYMLQNVATGKVMTLNNSLYQNGTSIIQSNATYNFNQQINISSTLNEDGDFDNVGFNMSIYANDNLSLVIDDSNPPSELGLYLTTLEGSDPKRNANGTVISVLEEGSELSRTRWAFKPTGVSRVFTIRNLDPTSNKLIGVNDSNNPSIIQWAIGENDSRFQWRVIPVIQPGWYVLQNVNTGLLMNVNGAGKTDGTSMIQSSGNVSDIDNNQQSSKFFFTQNSDNTFSISPGNTSGKKMLSVSASSNPDGQKVTLLSKNAPLQNWKVQYYNNGGQGLDDMIVTIRSANSSSNRLLAVYNNIDPNVIQWNLAESVTRCQWRLIPCGGVNYLKEGVYAIQNNNTNQFMDVNGSATANGSRIIQSNLGVISSSIFTEDTTTTISFKDNQKFEVTIDDNCNYHISPIHTKGTKFLSVNGGTNPNRNENNTQLFIWTNNPSLQSWLLNYIDFDDNSNPIYTIRSTDPSSNKLLGINNSTTPNIIQWNISESDSRFQWSFIQVEDKTYLDPGIYTIQNTNTGLVMDVLGAGTNNGTKVIQYQNNNANNQKFEVTIDDNCNYRISPLHTKGTKFLSVNGGTNSNRNINDTQIFIWDNIPSLQSWVLNNVFDYSNDSNVFSVRSIDPSANDKILGVHDATTPGVILWTAGEDDDRFLWRFIPVSTSLSGAKLTSTEAILNYQNLYLDENAVALKISPNPVNQDFEVSIKEFEAEENLHLSLVDGQGFEVYKENIGLKRNILLNTQRLGLKNSAYIVNVSSDNTNKRITQKMVVVSN